eukprot:CAMPEP_0113676824 /NCGR_PEP_ID=MMETSP0038_2-20120614/8882_1 /TAXON_ID=2898 /ORGANISM="Cryptomonas paramecium" /LENGTH=337 /DNA_ID=CAMNT_0000593945 /DNA_START=47 /DNA_END=1059 /DNA_ORIENTATION=+ /assembly_acc=CAM_ASM_000170
MAATLQGDGLETVLNGLQAQLNALTTKTDGMQADLRAELRAENQQLRAENQQLRAGLNILGTRTDQQGQELTFLRAENQHQRAGIQQLRAENQQLRAENQQLRAEVNVLVTKTDEQGQELTLLRTEKSNLESRLGVVESVVTDMKNVVIPLSMNSIATEVLNFSVGTAPDARPRAHRTRKIRNAIEKRPDYKSTFDDVCRNLGLSESQKPEFAEDCDGVIDKRNGMAHSAHRGELETKVAAFQSLTAKDCTLVNPSDTEAPNPEPVPYFRPKAAGDRYALNTEAVVVAGAVQAFLDLVARVRPRPRSSSGRSGLHEKSSQHLQWFLVSPLSVVAWLV